MTVLIDTGESVRGSSDCIEIQDLHPPMAERQLQCSFRPSQRSMLACGVLCASHIASQLYPLVLP